MEAEHRYSKVEWLFYIIILPLLLTALLSGIILQFLGVDVTGKIASAAREIPVISSLLPAEEGEADPQEQEATANKAKIQELQDQITALENEKQQADSDMKKKDGEIAALKKQIAELDKKGSVGQKDPLQTQADVYANMSPAKAALVLSQLSVTEAKQFLSKMSSKAQAAILEKMEPAIAAKMMSQ
ncbi:MotE family protein [Tumebacillus lipolyticus]|uniref:MotE family protein n=1 Tax=Tumebacillus lipolyticus TaxID=1280370 RepID=A0ABW5A1E1_9BACL